MPRCWLHALIVLFVVFGGVLVAGTSPGLAQTGPDECLLDVQDQTGSLPDGTALMQTATGKACVFTLRLCTNAVQPGCEPASFQTKRFRASGHCGAVARLEVTPSGTGSVCGAFTSVTVRTKGNGRKEGRCVVRAAVRSARTHTRRDVDRVTLLCEP